MDLIAGPLDHAPYRLAVFPVKKRLPSGRSSEPDGKDYLQHAPHHQVRSPPASVFERRTQRLQTDVPLAGINFFLYQGDSTIKSKQYGGMCIDEDQHLGSLIGFRNKLVLCGPTVSARECNLSSEQLEAQG